MSYFSGSGDAEILATGLLKLIRQEKTDWTESDNEDVENILTGVEREAESIRKSAKNDEDGYGVEGVNTKLLKFIRKLVADSDDNEVVLLLRELEQKVEKFVSNFSLGRVL